MPHGLQSPLKDEARVLYVSDYGTLISKENIRISPIHAIVTSKGSENNKCTTTAHNFTHEQEKDLYCLKPPCAVIFLWSMLILNLHAFLIYIAPIHVAVQKCISTSLQTRLLYHSHYTAWADHPGKRRMHYSMERKYYLSPLPNEIYWTVRECHECVRNEMAEKKRRPLQIFPTKNRYKKVFARDILGPISKTVNGHHITLVVMHR